MTAPAQPYCRIEFKISADFVGATSVPADDDDLAVIKSARPLFAAWRDHLLRPTSDGSPNEALCIHHRILAEIHERLIEGGASQDLHMPTLQELQNHLATSFPTIWLGGGQAGLFDTGFWGWVRTDSTDQIMFWREPLVVLAKATRGQTHAKEGMELSFAQISHLVVVVLAHGFTHHLTRWAFGQVFTPRGVGPLQREKATGKTIGEAGFRLEELLFGGNLVVEWRQGHPWDMCRVHALLFRVHEGHTYEISANRDDVQRTSGKIMRAVVQGIKALRLDGEAAALPQAANAFGVRTRMVLEENHGPPFPTELPQPLLPDRPATPPLLESPPGIRP